MFASIPPTRMLEPRFATCRSLTSTPPPAMETGDAARGHPSPPPTSARLERGAPWLSRRACDPLRPAGWPDRTHHAVPRALGPLVADPEPLIHGPGGVVEERGRGLRALGQVVRVRLDGAAPRRGDQRQRTPHGD